MSASASSRPSERRRRLARLLTDELGDRVGSPREARWIVEDALSSSEDDAAAEAFAREAAVRRQRGEPLQHVLGHWSFRQLDVRVDTRALVPRPETEVVVEAALGELARLAGRRPLSAVADLGTGSGVIALSLAAEVPDPGVPLVYATDASAAALSLAAENARRVLAASQRDRLELRLGSWYAALPAAARGGLDLVVSNPPYLSSGEWA
ncbi:MAG TPA: methyltransferase, partial [Acidimicrobiales bacterium]|nr:methyltransferase [Acidimicrobiales bacterium]